MVDVPTSQVTGGYILLDDAITSHNILINFISQEKSPWYPYDIPTQLNTYPTWPQAVTLCQVSHWLNFHPGDTELSLAQRGKGRHSTVVMTGWDGLLLCYIVRLCTDDIITNHISLVVYTFAAVHMNYLSCVSLKHIDTCEIIFSLLALCDCCLPRQRCQLRTGDVASSRRTRIPASDNFFS